MDAEKLSWLRARYADRGAFDCDDPVLSQAARDVQSPDGRRSLPYSGVPTFLGLPYAPSALGAGHRRGGSAHGSWCIQP